MDILSPQGQFAPVVMYKVVFENPRFLAVDKPSGVLTVPGREGESDTRACLSTELSRSSGRVWPVHRLDFEVSGLVLFAKDAEAHRVANGWFESRDIKKLYEAWSTGAPAPDWKPGQRFEWTSNLLRGKKRAYESPHGKPSVTIAAWMGLGPKQCLKWHLEPLTGRSHQLRYELSRHGFPIIGDKLYGSTESLGENMIALRSIRLDFSGCSAAKQYELPELISVPGLDEVVFK